MNVSLRVVQGPASGTSASLNAQAPIKLSSDANADLVLKTSSSVPVGVILAVGLPGGCRIQTADGKPEIGVSDRRVSDAVLRVGEKFQIADFVIEVTGGDRRDADTEPAEAAETALAFIQRMGIDLDDEELELLEEHTLPGDYVVALETAGHMAGALRVLAHWLPKGTSIQWSCACVRQHFGETLTATQDNALTVAEQWAANPSEESRRRAEQVAGNTEPADCFSFPCLAAFWSDGSIAPAGSPEVPAPEQLTGTAVAAALLNAAGQAVPPPFNESIQMFLDLAKPYPTP